MISPVASQWHDLLTVALLGTDRRDPPAPPSGPVADLVADAQRPTPSQRMLVQVAACVAVRRGGLLPAPPVPGLTAPADDPRPVTAAGLLDHWRYAVQRWPVLEEEILAEMVRRGVRPAPDLLVALLRRHRPGSPHRSRVDALAGPLGPWLAEHLPDLLGHPGRRPARTVAGPPDGALSELPIPEALRALSGADAPTVASALSAGIREGRLTAAHRAVLVNLLARLAPEVLGPVTLALDGIDAGHGGYGLAAALADCARTRRGLLDDLGVLSP